MSEGQFIKFCTDKYGDTMKVVVKFMKNEVYL
jgi:hypothetical protein